MSLYAEMLRRKFGGQLGESGEECLGFILEGATRMDQLLRDLRAFTYASTAGGEPSAEVDANETLSKVLANLKAAIEESGDTVSSGTLPCVRVHSFQLEQLFQNLIGNAIRYRSPQPPVIEVAAEQREGFWRFSVRDNGIGIEPQYKEQIFGMFKRLHSSAKYPGTGMGLAICQRIVERAGGRIWVESEPGIGATFFFTLPATRRA